MTLESWRTVTIILFIIFIITVILLWLNNFLKNRYRYSCRNDRIIKEEKKSLVKYKVYEVLGNSATYIDKYIIKEKGKNKTLICDYCSNYNYISYYVLLYSKHNKLIKIMEISEYNTTNCSKFIKLPRNCTKLNIVVNHVNDIDLKITLKGEVSMGSIIAYCVLESIAVFCLLFCFRHLLVEILCMRSKIIFLWSVYNTYSILILVIISIINYLILINKLKEVYKYKKLKGVN